VKGRPWDHRVERKQTLRQMSSLKANQKMVTVKLGSYEQRLGLKCK